MGKSETANVRFFLRTCVHTHGHGSRMKEREKPRVGVVVYCFYTNELFAGVIGFFFFCTSSSRVVFFILGVGFLSIFARPFFCAHVSRMPWTFDRSSTAARLLAIIHRNRCRLHSPRVVPVGVCVCVFFFISSRVTQYHVRLADVARAQLLS